MLSQPDSDAECLAAGSGTSDSTGIDVGLCTMGRRRNASVGIDLHHVVRLEMGLRKLRRFGICLVCHISGLVPGRSSAASRCERGGKGNVGSVACSYDARGRTATLAVFVADAAGISAGSAVFLLFIRLVFLHHLVANVSARRAGAAAG